MAITASLTGRLVFSTIHTNDAAGAVTRLIDMGIEPFLVTSSLSGVLAQRLVRRLCAECRVLYRPHDDELTRLGVDIARFRSGTLKVATYKLRPPSRHRACSSKPAGGCSACRGVATAVARPSMSFCTSMTPSARSA